MLSGLPLIGKLEAGQFSLPVLTLLLAGMDAFNPCAFFVLLFLLSLMVRQRSRRRMLFFGSEGRFLKLLSGSMMLGIGIILLIAPDRLCNLVTALMLITAALLFSFMVAGFGRGAKLPPRRRQVEKWLPDIREPLINSSLRGMP